MAPSRRVRTKDNLIARDFAAAAPNGVSLADITYIPTAEGWLYLAGVMDLFSRKIVGWAMARSHVGSTRLKGMDLFSPTAAVRMSSFTFQPSRRRALAV
jgi:transposase InsO family protein